MSGEYIFSTPSCRLPGTAMAGGTDAGGKGAGLLGLPPEWYPATLIIGPALFDRISTQESSILDAVARVLTDEILAPCIDILRAELLIVRSSAEGEGIRDRGRYASQSCAAFPPDIRAAVSTVYDSAHERGPAGIRMSALIQRMVSVSLQGHLSNEHRISRDAWTWTLERQVGSSASETQLRTVSDIPADDSALRCATTSDLTKTLRSVARRLSPLPYRYHLEWAWDGERLWIVQADRVPTLTGPPPGELWAPNIGQPIRSNSLEIWKSVALQQLGSPPPHGFSRWPKIANVQQFAQAGLPTPSLYVLQDSDAIRGLAFGHVTRPLAADLALLTSGDVVVRTDIDTGDEKPPFFLPKSDNLTDPDTMVDFLRTTTRKLLDSGLTTSQFAFIAHRYLRARSCAWTYAEPSSAIVRIDSTWGLVDGLNWLAHDSALVNIETGDVSQQILPKPAFLDVGMDRKWVYRETPTEWLWRWSIGDGQARTIAEGAHRLAMLRAEPLATMWFVGMLDGADSEFLPWYSSPYDIDPAAANVAVSPNAIRRVVLTLDDLDRVATDDLPELSVLRLRPGGDLVRSTEFVERVADLAANRNLVVEIEGSPLAHPYYIFRRRGIPVICVRKTRTDRHSVRHEKLVRDNIPSLIKQRGETAIAYRASESERPALLKSKMVEEALEVLRAAGPEEATDELADLMEVIDALKDSLAISDDSLNDAVARKRSRRGGFEETLVLVQTSPFGDQVGARGPNEPEVLPGLESLRPIARQWHVREEGRRVLISYVPPMPGEPQSFQTRLAGQDLVIAYQTGSIAIEAVDAGIEGEQMLIPGI
jgi:predicted house-cleaning noncanonical NTP pyrophosphatase (MazG superfamily)